MAPGKDNMRSSFSVMTERELEKFVVLYQIPRDLNPVLPAKDSAIYPLLTSKFAFYTRVCNFANYRVPFTKFLIKVLRFFRVHLSQINPFGLSRINHFELSCRSVNKKPDLNVFRYFYEFGAAGDWYTFLHRKRTTSITSVEKTSLKHWKDHFFWLDDRCLPADLVWRMKDSSMDFELKEGFEFDRDLAPSLAGRPSPVRPLPEFILLLGRVSRICAHGDKDWPIISRKTYFFVGTVMSLRDALAISSLDDLDCSFEENIQDDPPFLVQTASVAFPIRKQASNIHGGVEGSSGAGSSSVEKALETTLVDASVVPPDPDPIAVSEGSKQVFAEVDSDPEIMELDRELARGPPISKGSESRKSVSIEIPSPESLKKKHASTTPTSSRKRGNLPGMKSPSTFRGRKLTLSDLILMMMMRGFLRFQGNLYQPNCHGGRLESCQMLWRSIRLLRMTSLFRSGAYGIRIRLWTLLRLNSLF